jgi:thiamine-phosphate pyrophosphorylase
VSTRNVERMLDANANRAAEGLRALEDVARFLLDASDAASVAKDLRHAVRAALPPSAVAWRDTHGDVGEVIKAADEGVRACPVAVVRANAARAQEALRALEEALKLTGGAYRAVEAARYGVYRLESDILSLLPAWRLWQIRLYVLVDTALCADPVAVAAAAVRGGAGAVQLRAKTLDQRSYRELAARTQDAVRQAGGLFVVNDHVAVARAIDADGIHVGQEDLDPRDVRTVVGPRCVVGLSAHTVQQAQNGQLCADYLGLGPMYATTTKPHEPCRGPGLLDALRDGLRLPSYAIGGLDAARLHELRPRLPHGIAIAGAICRAPDPERAAAELLAILQPDELS